MDAATFLIQLLNAIQYGLLLFLVASGLTLIFGIMHRQQGVSESHTDITQDRRIGEVALPAGHGELLCEMTQQRVGNTQVAFGVLKVDRIHLVGHGRRSDFPGQDLLPEIAERNVAPKITTQVNENRVVTRQRITVFRDPVMAEERGWFEFGDVVGAICDKMTRRHPHVFGGERIASSADQSRAWEEHKKRERGTSEAASVLDGVPVGLPALTRAAKVGQRAASVGFDWVDWRGARAKIDEELAELEAVERSPDRAPELHAELGDVLLAVVNLARHLGVDAESALRASNCRFERRFRHLEERVRASGRELRDISAPEFDLLWNEAKTAVNRD